MIAGLTSRVNEDEERFQFEKDGKCLDLDNPPTWEDLALKHATLKTQYNNPESH